MNVKFKEKNGITLIALVITIIVLLILAGVSIAMLTGDNGILTQANEAKEQTEYKGAEEKVKLAIMGARADDGQMTIEELTREVGLQGGTLTGTEFPVEVEMDGYTFTVDRNGTITKKGEEGETQRPLPEGLEIGSTVTYTPSGTYIWQRKYCSMNGIDKTLNSAEENYKISEWKVLDIENGKVTLVPTNPTEGTVRLGDAEGYNNGVKLLNDACNSLYGNLAKGITARSINIEDIEKYMTEEALTSVHEYGTVTKYGEQVANAYTSNPRYPSMYAKEKLNVIDGNKDTNGLGMSEQTEFIEEAFKVAESIQPYQTYWYKDARNIQPELFKTTTNRTNYYFLLRLNSPVSYWLASRSVNIYSSNCDFVMCNVYDGSINANFMYDSSGNTYADSSGLFPIVSLSSELISGDATTGFSVK